MKFLKISFLSFALIGSIVCRQTEQKGEVETPVESEAALVARAREIHDRVITLDTHNDFDPDNFTDAKNYTEDLDSQVTLPKMVKGGLDVSWLIVYTGQGELTEEGYAKAHGQAMVKFNAIHWLTKEKAPDQIELALTSDDVRRIHASGKKVAMIGVENGYPLGTDLANVKKFADLGARYLSLAHNGHSQLSDSNTGEADDKWLHNGLSDLGKEAVRELNKWGIMVDVSHPSKKAIMDMLEISKAPLIASHSSARALCDHSRNLDDEQLEALKANGAVIQTVAFGTYVNAEKGKAYRDARNKLYESVAAEMGFTIIPWRERRALDDEARAAYRTKFNEVRKKAEPRMAAEVDAMASPVNISDYVDHIDYLVKKIGIDHVGISSDFDGGGGVKGWNDASETFNVTLELVKRGYTEEQIGKMWSGNLLRVLDQVQAVAKEMQEQG